MRYILFLLSVTFILGAQANNLDVFSDKPLKQLYFRYAEGSLKNAEPEKWVKRWGRFDGVVIKALNEEITGFDSKTTETLRLFKQTYPNKLLLLHFNGRASLPDFANHYAQSKDYLYFVGTTARSKILSSEAQSTVKVDSVSAFSIRKGLRNNANEDVVIVAKNDDGSLNWEKTEHAKLVSISKEGSITLERDILKTGKLELEADKAYIAQHVAKGPFSTATQRLWEYNWFQFENSNRLLPTSLPHYLNKQLQSQLKFFDGIQFDVLTEAHRTDNIGYPMKIDADADGKPDRFSPSQYDEAHRNGIYSFLANLRSKLGETRLILADGSYANQRATWLLNGIESESWPDNSDAELTQWSSGLNRHNYWRTFAEAPQLNYIKVADYHVPKKGKVEPTDNTRRLVVAAGGLTDSAIVPAFRPKGLAFHKWPEFRKLKNIGRPIGELVTLTTQSLRPVTLVKVAQKNIKFSPQSLNNLTLPYAPSSCLTLPSPVSSVVVKLTASLAKQRGKRPHVISIGTQKDQQHTFVGNEDFTSWFNFENVGSSPLCLTVQDGNDTLTVKELFYAPGDKVEARAFEKAVLFANNNNNEITLTEDQLKPLAESFDIKSILKGRKEIKLAAKDISIIRF